MKRLIKLLPIAAVICIGMLSCDNEKDSAKEDAKQSGPQIATLGADEVSIGKAMFSGRVSGLSGVALDFECGIEYSTDELFSNEYSIRQKVDKKYTEDSFSITVSGVLPGKKYYYRAYYFNQQLIYYGEVKCFTFDWPAIQPNGDYAVDLGLSVKWATCNVGAATPEGYGDYFAWGDTATRYKPGYAQSQSPEWKEGKENSYNWPSYKYSNGSSNILTKYCSKNDYGNIDSYTTLLPVDDVAHYKWGGYWRMPTKAEFQELLDSCDCEFITQNGVKGLKVTSRKDSSQSIFLPTAGYRIGTKLNGVGSNGDYWSSSLNTDNPYNAWYLYFYSGNHYTSSYERYSGQSVRPVCP